MNDRTYLPLLEQIKKNSIEKRWIPLRDGADLDEVPNCEFCKLDSLLNVAGVCNCPFNIDETSCMVGLYFEWLHEHDTIKKRELAQKIIDLIEAVDCEAWTDELVKRGVLKQ